MKVSFRAVDENPGNIVKAAIDDFEILEGMVDVSDYIDENIKMAVSPNPFSSGFSLTYDMVDPKGELIMLNAQGQTVVRRELNHSAANLQIGEDLHPGIYFLSIRSGEKWSAPVKVLKAE